MPRLSHHAYLYDDLYEVKKFWLDWLSVISDVDKFSLPVYLRCELLL